MTSDSDCGRAASGDSPVIAHLLEADARVCRRAAERVARVQVPDCDPVHGSGGPMREYWCR